MKLTTPNKQKLMVTRANLWARVYEASLKAQKVSNIVLQSPQAEADFAVKEFDQRFPMENK